MRNLLKRELENRPDLLVIFDLIPEGSRVLDLGCGEGILLQHLKLQKKCSVCGIEISQDKIIECVSRGVPVINEDLDQGLNDYPDNLFDCVILSQTLQAVHRPDTLLKAMMRIGKKAYVSIINIGALNARIHLFLKGEMPVTKTLPYQWYETKNIHLSTIRDFRKLCKKFSFKIEKSVPIAENFKALVSLCPNLFAPTCVFVISKEK